MQHITISARIAAPIEKAWEYFTHPAHIMQWNHASPDWHCPSAENDLRPGGAFRSRMEARDGSEGFDFVGIYDEVQPYRRIAYTMGDGRKVGVDFQKEGEATVVTTTFDPEGQNSEELQRAGWQAILDNYKKHVEEH